MPVALIGSLIYLSQIVILAALRHTPSPLLARVLPLLLGANPAAAAFFVIIQAFVLRQWCPWCCGIHAAACLGAWFAILGMRNPCAGSSHLQIPRSARPQIVLGALFAVAVLVVTYGIIPEVRAENAIIQRRDSPARVTAEKAGEARQVISLH